MPEAELQARLRYCQPKPDGSLDYCRVGGHNGANWELYNYGYPHVLTAESPNRCILCGCVRVD